MRDLYELYPDFNIDIVEEQEVLFGHEIVIWHHPFYWYSCPPLMKQWIDVVLQYNWAYGPNGFALKGKYCLNAITAGGPREVYSPTGRNHYTINEFLRPFEQTAHLCGMQYLPPFVITGANRLKSVEVDDCESTYERALNWLSEADLEEIEISDQKFLNDLDQIRKGELR